MGSSSHAGGSAAGAFAARLRRIREAKGMSCYRLAQLSGISREGISRLEEEGSDPKLSTIYKLAGALGVAPSRLVVDRAARE
jgi:transcriptional regulator with XRE-family HTH domain